MSNYLSREEISENYKTYMDYVEKTLKESGNDQSLKHPFRSRSFHTKRVLKWASRLSEGCQDADREVLFLAAIFHDIGYACQDLDEHQKASEKLFIEFANRNNFDPDLVSRVSSCISIHSDKDKLKNPETLTIEQILLMEADLLDEEGALAICWDAMACGYEGKCSFEDALERTGTIIKKKRQCNPMVTYLAKLYWNEKTEFVEDYLRRLKFDLEI